MPFERKNPEPTICLHTIFRANVALDENWESMEWPADCVGTLAVDPAWNSLVFALPAQITMFSFVIKLHGNRTCIWVHFHHRM
jgi:hypothetical protein